MFVQKDLPGRGAANFLNLIFNFNVFQMVVTAYQMAAALLMTGVTVEERQVQNILHSLPRVTIFAVQCFHHRELQKYLQIIFPELLVGQERQFNHIVSHHPWVFNGKF
jgi:hypothetical protein